MSRVAAFPLQQHTESVVAPVRHRPMTLSPIPWGRRDWVLAQGVFRSMVATTPPTEIPYNPVKDRALQRALQAINP